MTTEGFVLAAYAIALMLLGAYWLRVEGRRRSVAREIARLNAAMAASHATGSSAPNGEPQPEATEHGLIDINGSAE